MTLKQCLIAGVAEQAIVLGVILPATGWWFSFCINCCLELSCWRLRNNYVLFKEIDLGVTSPRSSNYPSPPTKTKGAQKIG